MARVVVTLRIMPESPETDLKKLEQKASEKIKAFGCEVGKTEIRPVAFGLKALLLYFIMDEDRGSTEDLEKDLATLDYISSVEVTDVRRTIG